LKADTENDNNPLDKLPSVLRQNLDKNLCTCMDVPKMDVINAIANGASTVEAVQQQTYAATGAGCCLQQVERLIECLCAPEPPKRRTRRQRKQRKP
jgi:NAD(P)H-nitrite reductase large subunit